LVGGAFDLVGGRRDSPRELGGECAEIDGWRPRRMRGSSGEEGHQGTFALSLRLRVSRRRVERKSEGAQRLLSGRCPDGMTKVTVLVRGLRRILLASGSRR